MPKKCPGCSAKLSNGAEFCSECGLPQPPLQKSSGCLKVVGIIAGAFVVLALLGAVISAFDHGSSTTADTAADNDATLTSTQSTSAIKARSVTLTLKATRAGTSLHLSGTTNLPGGAVITYEVQEVNSAWITDDEHAKVKHGRYGVVVKSVPQDRLEVWAAFVIMDGVVKQPQKLVDMYGENGEKIPNGIAQYGGSRRVEITTTVR